jgi:hypothetical protein
MPAHYTAFQILQQALIHALVLALPNFAEAFILETDASGSGIGAVIMQQGRPLAYFSAALCPKNAAMSTYEKEALAILEALNVGAIISWEASLSSKLTNRLSSSSQIRELRKEFSIN